MGGVVVVVRLPKALVEKIDELIEEGYYRNRSEFLRDAVRRAIFEHEYLKLMWRQPVIA